MKAVFVGEAYHALGALSPSPADISRVCPQSRGLSRPSPRWGRWYARPDGRPEAVCAVRYSGAAGPAADLVPRLRTTRSLPTSASGWARAEPVQRPPPHPPRVGREEARRAVSRVARRTGSSSARTSPPRGCWRSTTSGRTASGATGAGSRSRSPRSRTRPGGVLPHEHTHPQIRQERQRLLRGPRGRSGSRPSCSTTGTSMSTCPPTLPALEVLGRHVSRLWRLPDLDLAPARPRRRAPHRRRPPPLRERARARGGRPQDHGAPALDPRPWIARLPDAPRVLRPTGSRSVGGQGEPRRDPLESALAAAGRGAT